MARGGMSQGRAITIDTATAGNAASLDAFKAMLEIVEGIEKRIAEGETVATILVANKVRTVKPGRVHNAVHVFDYYGDFGAGTYAFEFVETVPTIEDIS